MERVVNLIYIGEKFYWKTNTSMSSLYTVDGERYDWGFVQRDLTRGIVVNIRPATENEILEYRHKFADLYKFTDNQTVLDGV